MDLRSLILSTENVRSTQYMTRRVGAVDFKYIPRTKQLYIQAQAFPLDPTSRRSPYKLNLLFNGISWSEEPSKDFPIRYNTDKKYTIYLSKPNVNLNTAIRCSCPDYYFMWEYFNKQNKSLIGPHKTYVRKTKTYPPRNPSKSPGLCKHLLELVKLLMKEGILEKNNEILNYIDRPRK